METMTSRGLVGVIMFSQDPEKLAQFYADTLGIPFERAQHGGIREHIECEFNGIHFALLRKGKIASGGNVIPSFAISDLAAFLQGLKARNIHPLHPIIDIGEGKRVSTISDPEGNAVRLIQLEQVS